VQCAGVLLNGQPWDPFHSSFSPVLQIVDLPSPATAVAVATRHACAVIDGGNGVACWGYGANGELGDGTATSSLTPVEVSPTLDVPVHQIEAAGDHTCVLAGEPAVIQCWGELPSVGTRDIPTILDDQPTGEIAELHVGWRHDCVLLTDGRVQCWGLNIDFVLGNEGASTSIPTDVDGITDAVALDVGRSHSCVVREDGRVSCWGQNHRGGQLGAPSTVGSSAQPLDVALEVVP
jgi:alpha-tubulin suppressor-like RCC1 family protein